MEDDIPTVGRIEGIMLTTDESTRRRVVVLQYTDHNNGWHQTTMPLKQSVKLLNLLDLMVKSDDFEYMRSEPDAQPDS